MAVRRGSNFTTPLRRRKIDGMIVALLIILSACPVNSAWACASWCEIAPLICDADENGVCDDGEWLPPCALPRDEPESPCVLIESGHAMSIEWEPVADVTGYTLEARIDDGEWSAVADLPCISGVDEETGEPWTVCKTSEPLSRHVTIPHGTIIDACVRAYNDDGASVECSNIERSCSPWSLH